MSSTRFFILFILSHLLWTGPTYAETFYPLVTYQCDASADIVKVTNTRLHGDEAKTFAYSDADGTYSPWNMVKVEDIKGISKITNKQKIIKTCQLSTGVYTITIDPQVFPRDLTGRCDDSISAAVTVEFDGIELQERMPFESFCHGNAPIITQVLVLGATSEVKIKRIPKYQFY